MFRRKHNVWKGLAAGCAGGLAGSFAMDKFQELWRAAKNSGDGQKSGGSEESSATAKMADAASEKVLGHEVPKEKKPQAATAVHYLLGAGFGALYGATAEVYPDARVGAGLPFGAAVWLGADEIAGPAMGFAASPLKAPISSHFYALASHLAYGLATEGVRHLIRH